MKKVFYNELVILEKVEKLIKSTSMPVEEKEELWKIIDEIVHHRIMGCILGNLPKESHEEFLDKFKNDPFDDELIDYLEEKSGKVINEEIRKEIINIENEIIKDIQK
jgi:hypothetical protein